jgi:hypothetical protein
MNNGYEKVEKNKDKEYIKGEKVIAKGEVEDSKIVEILGNSAYVEGDEFIFSSEEESLPLASEISTGITLKDGNIYTPDKLSTKMLMSMGYSIKEAGEIIKNNKC